MNKLSINIILSTYNGAGYLPEFLLSLENQTLRPTRLVWRDDGSRDNSPHIVREWAARTNTSLQELSGPNLGAAHSFITAIEQAEAADITLLADQDDVWLPNKIERAAVALPIGANATATLYATSLSVVDHQLRPLRDTEAPHSLGFASAACESVLTGCTMAFNSPLANLLRRVPTETVAMHDWWIYLVGSGTGNVIFEPEPSILYRQHGANVIGASEGGLSGIISRIRALRSAQPNIRSRQIAMFLRLFANEGKPEALALARQLVESRASLIRRFQTALSAPIRRQSSLNRLTTRITILTNRF